MAAQTHPAASSGTSLGRGQRLQGNLSRFLLGYALLAMGTGLVLGELTSTWNTAQRDLIATATTVMVFMVIYPMMVGLKFEALAQAGRTVRGLSLALVMNFVWAPLLGLVLARIFLDDPMLPDLPGGGPGYRKPRLRRGHDQQGPGPGHQPRAAAGDLQDRPVR